MESQKELMDNQNEFYGGIDIGNKNYKLSMAGEGFEFPIAFKEITKYSYENEEVGQGTKKVKYKGRYFLVGLECNNILPKNKGDKSYSEEASMIKLTGLSEFLKKKEINEGNFKLVTGTPINDYSEYKDDYKDLLIDEEAETIVVDRNQYSIQVTDAHISKQCAAVVPTIKDWKDKEHLILIDLGGGTADIAYFRRGTVVRYITIDFPLNKIMEDLGNYLNGLGLGLMRPDETDSGYLFTMENVVKDGRYLNITSLDIDGETVELRDIISKWLLDKVDEVANNVLLRLGLSDTIRRAVEVYYFGGGALLLKDELSKNETFTNKTVLEEPEFANVKAYDAIARVREWN